MALGGHDPKRAGLLVENSRADVGDIQNDDLGAAAGGTSVFDEFCHASILADRPTR